MELRKNVMESMAFWPTEREKMEIGKIEERKNGEIGQIEALEKVQNVEVIKNVEWEKNVANDTKVILIGKKINKVIILNKT